MASALERAAYLRDKLASGALGLRVSGVTITGAPVIGGVYNLGDRYGIPLEVALAYFQENALVVDWQDYFDDAVGRGRAKPDKVLRSVESAIADSGCAEEAHNIIERLRARHERIL